MLPIRLLVPKCGRFSGPLRAGLIEATEQERLARYYNVGFPAPCGPASLKLLNKTTKAARCAQVFRPLAGRPH